jgi:uncharacterized membrane protein
MHGSSGWQHTVGLPKDKALAYTQDIMEVLNNPQNYISFRTFQKIHSKLVHASLVMPCMAGFMTELNWVLATHSTTAGLGRKSPLRETFQDFAHFLMLATNHPSHITEIVGSDLPHVYG